MQIDYWQIRPVQREHWGIAILGPIPFISRLTENDSILSDSSGKSLQFFSVQQADDAIGNINEPILFELR